MKRPVAIVAALVAAVATFFVVVLVRKAGSVVQHHAPTSPAAAPIPRGTAACPHSFLGVVSYNLPQFERQTGIYPSMTVKYIQWGSPFPAKTILQDRGLGVDTLIVLEPRPASPQDIAEGKDDSFLAGWAAADRRLNLPITLSFAPEANGSWYPWGTGHITAATYRGMWRHVHDVLLRDGARKITWMWQINVIWPRSEPISWLWPGSSYVDEVGIDGHLGYARDLFRSAFSRTVAMSRAVARKPVLISEVSVAREANRPRQITGLFAGACADRLAGLVWFDVKHPGRANFQLEGDPAALAAFRAASDRYMGR